DQLLPHLENVGFPYMMMKEDPFRMVALTDLVLATSGTATLVVGLLKKPMVIMYKMSWLTAKFARLVVRSFFGLPNLILDRKVVPEMFQEECTPEKLSAELERYLDDPKYFEQTRNELGQIVHRLGDRGATGRVAQALKEFMPS